MTDKAMLTNLIGGSLYRSTVQMNQSSAGKSDFFMATKPSSQPLSLFCPERERERERDMRYSFLFSFSFFGFGFGFGREGSWVVDLKEAFCFFPPFFLIFLLGLFCLLLMMISIYSSMKGIDPTI